MSRAAAQKSTSPARHLLALVGIAVSISMGCVASTSGTTGSSGGQSGTAGKAGGGGRTAGVTGGTIGGSGGAAVGSGGSGGETIGGSGGASAGMGTGGIVAGTGGSAGRAGSGGTAGRLGTGGTGGRGGVGGSASGPVGTVPTTPPPNCGSTPINQNPFGCPFAWGRNNPGGALTAYSYLQFMSFWTGAEVRADGTFSACNGCTWLSSQVSKTTNLIPVYYAYFIGYLGHVNGLPDGNAGGPPNLTTGGADLIRSHRASIINMFASYAQQSHAVWPTRPLVWLLDGDFVQYTASTQTNPLSYAELAQLASDITCAIKANMPNAVVAIDHSTWNANDVTDGFWGAMNSVYYDMVWTTGMGTSTGFFDTVTTAASYNGATATYAYLHRLTGRTIFVDTSFASSAMADSWSNAPATVLNARIADGVIAANITGTVPANYATAIAALQPSLTTTCH